MIVDQVDQHGLYIIPKAAAIGAGAVEGSFEQSHGELMGQLFGRVLVADGAQQIAIDDTAVPLQQFVPSGGGPECGITVGFQNLVHWV
jgi:hypothetical protein